MYLFISLLFVVVYLISDCQFLTGCVFVSIHSVNTIVCKVSLSYPEQKLIGSILQGQELV